MALTLDIKPNDALEKSALNAAKALDLVAANEKRANALSDKLGKSFMAAGDAAAYINKQTESYGKRAEKALSVSERAGKDAGSAQKKRNAEAGKGLATDKKDTEEKKRNSEITRKIGTAVTAVGASILAATAAATAMGTALALSAKHAGESKQGALALLNAWTHGRGEETMKRIDVFAQQIGMSTEEARQKFIDYRKTSRWVTNQSAADLLKLRQDILAVSKSSAIADEEIGSILSNADNPAMFAAKLAEVKRAYGGVGSGALAAADSLQSVDAAQNRISNTVGEALAKLWKEIGPSIGKAANRLAGFVEELFKSDEGKAALLGIADGFKSISEAINKENMTTALNAIRATAEAVGTVVKGVSAVFGGKIGKSNDQLHAATEAFDENARALEEKRAEIFGRSVADGLAAGIASGTTDASNAAVAMADKTQVDFAKALGIQSPSKVFKKFGQQTVEGFRIGEESELGASMPLQEAAAVMPKPVPQQEAVAVMPAPTKDKGNSRTTSGSSIVIENLNVQGGGTAEENARAIRQEIQMLMQAGQLARGYA